uniref:Putative secreted protein n=1 Tax=Amblyomma triste TaxID=251400 RepID=A0A023FZQ6_AMBTT
MFAMLNQSYIVWLYLLLLIFIVHPCIVQPKKIQKGTLACHQGTMFYFRFNSFIKSPPSYFINCKTIVRKQDSV